MIRGLLSGTAWGAVIGIVVLALTSQLADWRDLTPAITREIASAEPGVASPEVVTDALPAPARDAAPEADETPSVVAASDPAITQSPAVETDAPGVPDAPELAATPDQPVEPEAPVTTPEPETELAALPATPEPVVPATPGTPIPQPAPLSPQVDVPDEAPETIAAPEEEPDLPEAPEEETVPQLAVRTVPQAQPLPTAPVAPAAPEAPAPAPQPAPIEEAALAPELQPSPDAPPVEAPAPVPAPVATPQPPVTPVPETPPVAEEAPEPPLPITRRPGSDEEEEADLPQVSVRTNRPPVVEEAEPETPPEAPVAALTPPVAAPAPPTEVLRDGLALSRNAVAFDAAPDVPRLSVVLIDDGDNTLAGAPDLADLPFPVSFAVAAAAPTATEAARAYREAGHEVALIPDLPERGRPDDVEGALIDNLLAVPQAVALIDPDGKAFQNSRVGLAQVILAAGETGHGMVTFSLGSNSAQQIARRKGVPAGQVFRVIDPGTDRLAVGRALTQAVSRARRDGQAIVLAPADPDTLAAMVEWALESRSTSVALSPLSAALAGD